MIGALNNLIGQIAEDLGAKKLNSEHQDPLFPRVCRRSQRGELGTRLLLKLAEAVWCALSN